MTVLWIGMGWVFRIIWLRASRGEAPPGPPLPPRMTCHPSTIFWSPPSSPPTIFGREQLSFHLPKNFQPKYPPHKNLKREPSMYVQQQQFQEYCTCWIIHIFKKIKVSYIVISKYLVLHIHIIIPELQKLGRSKIGVRQVPKIGQDMSWFRRVGWVQVPRIGRDMSWFRRVGWVQSSQSTSINWNGNS